MKNIKYILVIVGILLAWNNTWGQTTFPVTIDENTFPDENFRALLIAQFGETIEESEAQSKTNWNWAFFNISALSGKTISNFDGIEVFADYLVNFEPQSYSSAKNINLSNFSKLKYCRITHGGTSKNDYIESINLTNCTSLEEVKAYNCKNLTYINLTCEKNNLNTVEIYCSPVSTLIMPDNYCLNNEFKAWTCAFTSLDMKNNTGTGKINVGNCYNLEFLDLSNCQNISGLTTIAGTSYCQKLISVKFYNGEMPNFKSIDIRKCSNLIELDLSGGTNLEEIIIDENPQLMSGLKLSETMNNLTKFSAFKCNLQPSFDLSKYPSLTTVDFSVNKLTALKEPNNTITGNLSQSFGEPLEYLNGKFWIKVADDFDYDKVKTIKIGSTVKDLNNFYTEKINGLNYLCITDNEETAQDYKNRKEIFYYEYLTGAANERVMPVSIRMCPVTYWNGNISSDWFDENNWSGGVPNNEKAAFVMNERYYHAPVIDGDAIARELHVTNNRTVTLTPNSSLIVKENDGIGGKVYTEEGSYIVLLADTIVEDNLNANRTVGAQFYGQYLTTSEKEITHECNIKVQRFFRQNKWDRFAVPVYGCNSQDVQGKTSYNPYLYTYDETYCFREKFSDIFSENNNNADSVSKYLGIAWQQVEGDLYQPRLVFDPSVGYNYYSFTEDHKVTFTGTTKNVPLNVNLSYTNNDDGKNSTTETHKAHNGLDGWNFLGNPYTVAIDWTKVEKSGINGSVYILDNDNSTYYVCNSDGETNTITSVSNGETTTLEASNPHNPQYILPTQGFFVRAESYGANIVLPYEAEKVASTSILKSAKKQDFNKVKLAISNGEKQDIATVYFRSGASNNYDSKYDAYKMQNGSIDLYSIANKDKFCINALDSQTDSTVVKLGVSVAKSGSYTIKVAELNLQQGNAYLVDSVENKTINISETDNYTFETEKGTFDNRFYIVFKSMNPQQEIVETKPTDELGEITKQEIVETEIDNLENNLLEEIATSIESVSTTTNKDINLTVYPNPASNYIKISKSQTINNRYYIYNNLGKLCLSGTIEDFAQIDITSLNSGMYIIFVDNKSVKFIKQ